MTFYASLAQIRNRMPPLNQMEAANYKSFTNIFVEAFNAANDSMLLAVLSADYLEKVPAKEHLDFLGFFRKSFGNITHTNFRYFDDKGSAVYTAQFGSTLMDLIYSLDETNKIRRFVITDPNFNQILPLKVNKTKMVLPFDSTWYVFWGGLFEDNNYHVTSKSQKNAYDFVIRNEKNLAWKTDGKVNDDYYAFGQHIYAPCNGKVIAVTDGIADNTPGIMNAEDLTGNTIIIKTNKNEYLLLAHFKNQTIRVRKDDKIKKGQLLGLCGNSGNSSEPHLHLHMMNVAGSKEAEGIQVRFRKLFVNGKLYRNYAPIKGERVQKS
jgi:murein DD-endopeptidase MepM/ murein hydrolase activator NlpD